MNKLFYGLILLLLFNSCKSSKRNYAIPFNKMNKESKLQIPFEFKNNELISLIDSLMPDTLLEKENDLPINIKILKGTISNIDLNEKSINIKLSVKVFLDKKIASYSIASGTGEIELDLYSEIDIDKEWNFKTKTSLVDYRWIEKPSMKFIGINFSAPEIVEKYIDYKQMDWMNQIDSTISKSNIIKKPIDSLVVFFSEPFTVDSAGTIGLKIVPTSIGLSPFKSFDNKIQGQLSINFNNELLPLKRYDFIDSIPEPKFFWNYTGQYDPVAIVTLSLDQSQTQVLLDDFLTYQNSSTKSFDVKGNKIQIDNINVLFNKDIITAIVEFSGDKTGEIVVKSRPLWDKDQKKLKLLNRSAEISISGFGTQFFINLFKNKIQKKIMDGLEDVINSKIKDTFEEINSIFEKAKLKNSLKITNYNMPIQLEDEFLMIDISFQISGEINWNKLNIVLTDHLLSFSK